MTGTVLPGFLDAHVHLALIDPAALLAGGIARVVDLGGWTPAAAGSAAAAAPHPDVVHAGQFLAAPGGYPGESSWAPAGSVCEVATVTDAAEAVGRQLAGGASVIKVTLNAEAGPVLDRDTLAAIVARSHESGTPVVAHAEGVGQAVRAFVAGVDALAHTPFSERIVDELVDAMAGRMTWISTLDIHGWGEPNDNFARASDNLRRFHAHNGRVLYGTDLGNGPLPLGLNRREVEALLDIGMSPDEVLGALTGTGLSGGREVLAEAGPSAGPPARGTVGDTGRPPRTAPRGTYVTVVPGERPREPGGFVDWLCGARAVTRAELKETA